MSIKLRWLGYVCFEIILSSGKVLVIDPFIEYAPNCPIKWEEVTGADYIAVTHGHWDHITSVGKLAHKFHSRVICSYDIVEQLSTVFDLDTDQLIKVRSGDSINFPDLKIEVKKGEHVTLRKRLKNEYIKSTGNEPPPFMPLKELLNSIPFTNNSQEATELNKHLREACILGGEQLNFVFETKDNIRIYIFSSSPYDYLQNEVLASHVNVFIPQMRHEITNEHIEEAAKFSLLSGAEIIIPSHHDGKGLDHAHKIAKEFKKCVESQSKAHVEDIEIGKWYDIGMIITPSI